MRVSLVPDRLFETYEEITPEYLRQRGIRLLLSDLDYTLAPKYVPHPDDRVREWLRRMEEGGVQVMILSNNRSSHRVETFCRELGIPYVAFLGEDEISAGVCAVKDLSTSEQVKLSPAEAIAHIQTGLDKRNQGAPILDRGK